MSAPNETRDHKDFATWPVQKSEASSSAESSADLESTVEDSVAEPEFVATATVENGYPEEWVAMNLPVLDGHAVSGKYLEEYEQLRLVGDSIATDEQITQFGEDMVRAGWTEYVPGLEYTKDNEEESVDGVTARYSLNIAVEAGFSTFTVAMYKFS